MSETTDGCFKCEICNKSLSSKRCLKAHQVVHTNDRPFKCETCHKAFARKCELRDHEFVHNKTEKPFKCEICHKTFVKTNQLKVHLLIHTNTEAQFKCESCDKSFVRKQSLLFHQVVHNKDKAYTCEECHKIFATKYKLRHHLIVHDNQRQIFECEICNKTFSTKYNLKFHKIAHDNERESFECEKCSKTFVKKTGLESHQCVYKPEIQFNNYCKRCGTSFTHIGSLRAHLRMCPDCHFHQCRECKALVPFEELTKHISDVHNRDSKGIECDICYANNSMKADPVIHAKNQGTRLLRSQTVTGRDHQAISKRKSSSLLGEFFFEPLVNSAADNSFFECQTCHEEFVDENEFKLHIAHHIKREPILEKYS